MSPNNNPLTTTIMKKEFICNVFIAGVQVPCISTNGLHLADEALDYITRIYQLNCEYVAVYDYIRWCFTYVSGGAGPMPTFRVEYSEDSSIIKVVFTSSAICFNDIARICESDLGVAGNIPCITVENGNIVMNISLEGYSLAE